MQRWQKNYVDTPTYVDKLNYHISMLQYFMSSYEYVHRLYQHMRYNPSM